MSNVARALAIVGAEVVFAGSFLVVGATGGLHGTAYAAVSPQGDTAQAPQEDDPQWSCVDDGNRVCGPASDNYGHTPGCYDDGGVMVAPWPCHVAGADTSGRMRRGESGWLVGCLQRWG